MTRQLLSIIVPVYCNEASLSELHSRLQHVADTLNDLAVDCEFIYVDDGSLDGSFEVMQEIAASDTRVTLLQLSRNFGVMRAYKAALAYVKGDAFVSIAADLQEPPELISAMVERWKEGNRFVICERTSRGDPLTTRILAWIYYRLVRLFIVPGFPIGGFDLALMDRCMLDTLRYSSKTTYTPILAYWMGFPPAVIKYRRLPRLHGSSKWTVAKKVNALADVFAGFSVKPLRAIAFVGIFVAGISVAYSIAVLIAAIAGRIDSPGFPTIVALISFLSGLQLLTLGVVGEYIWRTLDQVNGRPESVVSFERLRKGWLEE